VTRASRARNLGDLLARASQQQHGMRTTLMLLALAACSSDKSPPTSSKPESAMTGKREHGMRHCPSSVPGSITKMTETSDGVDVTITAGDAEAQRQILALARPHERIGNPTLESQHDGMHGGPGNVGFCPIIHANTVITVSEAPGGARIHVRAGDPKNKAALVEATRKRVEALPGVPNS
jgi:hypothetical protein